MGGVTQLDIARTQPKKSLKPRYFIAAVAILLVAFVIRYLWVIGQADFVADSDAMVFSEVKRGNFSVSVRGNGVLVPANIQWLATNVEARVERLAVKPGKMVREGDLIVELSNPQLVQKLEETVWELEALEADTKAQQVAQESSLLDRKAAMLNAKLDFESSQLKQKAQAELFKQKSGAVSRIDYENTLMETKQFKQRWQIQQARYAKMQENLAAQNNARKARLNKMKKTLERIQQQVDGLQVTATMNSVVQDIPLEPGQQIPVGSNIAKLAQLDSLIAELQVPELQIRDVALGQKVLIDTRNSQFEGYVSRVDPAVVNGNVQVDVEFSQTLPDDARPDLTVDGEIRVAEIADALHVSRPLFAQSESQAGVYRLTDDGQFAERVTVKLGKGSVNQIQIIEGLTAGDRIIISDSSTWETYQKIRIN